MCTLISRASSKASQVFDQRMLLPAVLPMETAPGSWESCWTMVRAGGSDTSLPQGSWYSCCSAMVLFQVPYGCLTPTQQNLWCMDKGGSRQNPGCEQMEPFTAAKLSPWQERNRHQNMQRKVDNPHKPQFFECPHEKPHVAGGKLNKSKRKR